MSPKTKRVTKQPKAKSKSTKVSSNDCNKALRESVRKDPLGFGRSWKPGRPSDYDPKYCDEIIINARKGKTFEDFASKLNVHIDTLIEWKRKHREFSLAYNQAKQEAIRYMINLGKREMLGRNLEDAKYDEDGKLIQGARKLNSGIWKYFMACRFGWREFDPPKRDEDDRDLEWVLEDEDDDDKKD